MHLATTPLLYRVLTFGASARHTRTVGSVLLVLFVAVMAIHMVMDEFILHALSFALSVHLIRTRILRLISLRVKDAAIRKKVRSLALFAGCKCSSNLVPRLGKPDVSCSDIRPRIRHLAGRPRRVSVSNPHQTRRRPALGLSFRVPRLVGFGSLHPRGYTSGSIPSTS